MLAQRIGPLDMSKVVTESSPAKESGAGINQSMQSAQRISLQGKTYCDCPKRVYYDKFVDLGDGRMYKGEW